MQQAELFLVFTRPLDEAGLQYMVTGSVAGMVYGEPRLTNDIDIVLELPAGRIPAFAAAFPAETFYCPPEEVLTIESRRPQRGHFNLIHHASGYKADVYIEGNDPLHAWGLRKRKHIDLGDAGGLWLAPPEYVIVRKLEYYREGGSEKHLVDVRGVLAVSADAVDRGVLEDLISRRGLSDVWAEIEESS